MLKFMCFGFHSYFQFSQRIKVFENAKQHNDKMLITVKTLHIRLTTGRFFTNFHYFSLIKQIYYLTIYRLSDKITIFAHCLRLVFDQCKSKQKGRGLIEPRPYFFNLNKFT